jgi:hypothetical protein
MAFLLPATTYTAQAVDGYLSYTKDGKEQIVVKFAIVGGQYDGQTVTWTGYFTDKTFDRTIQSLRYCGWRGEDIDDLTGIDAHEVEIVVDHNTYDGKTFARVSWVNQIGGKARMPADDARAFAESIKGRIARMTPSEPEPDDSTPF